MIKREILSIEAFEKIKHYILENQIEELYTDAQVVSLDINNLFEPAILDTIDLCLESLNCSDNQSAIKNLETVRKNIVGDKYEYIKNQLR